MINPCSVDVHHVFKIAYSTTLFYFSNKQHSIFLRPWYARIIRNNFTIQEIHSEGGCDSLVGDFSKMVDV